MPVLIKTLLTYLYDSEEIRQLHKFYLMLFPYGSPNIGKTSTETYSFFLKDKLFKIFVVGITEDYKNRFIAKVPIYDQYDFKLVIKLMEREIHLDLERLKCQLKFESGDAN